ncbi:hypothetical protein [Noviherbaspirillum pedocola]|nr:hypothetical protein [Noviherbaspirillum pedocola]
MAMLVKKTLAVTAIATSLALAFAAYLRPDFMLDLANRLLLCG